MINLMFALAITAVAQVPVQQAPVSLLPTPVVVHLMTVTSHPGSFGGQRLAVPGVRVAYVVGPRLVVVGQPRTRAFDHTFDPEFRFDKLLVLLPGQVSLSRGQLIDVTGVLRTVAGARATGVPIDEALSQSDKGKRAKDSKRAGRLANATMIVADSVQTLDGAVITGR